jgi:hypothetical protein
MGYTDKTLGKNGRQPTAGPLSKFKGKATSMSSENIKLSGYGKGSVSETKKKKTK